MSADKQKLFYFIRPGRELNTGGKHYNHQFIKFAGISQERVLGFHQRKLLQLMVFKILYLLIKNRNSRHVFVFDVADANRLFIALLVARLFLRKWVTFIVICHHLEEYQWLDYHFKQFALNYLVSGIVAPSHFAAAQVKADDKKKKVLAPRLRLFPPEGIGRRVARAEQSVMLLYVGGLVPRKNILYHLQVLSKLPDRFKLTVCSKLIDKKYYEECKRYLKISDVGDRVRFVIDPSDLEVAAQLASSDAFLFLSQLEGFGMVNIEAMAHGLPVFASDIAAHRELMIDAESGFLVPLDDAKAVARRIMAVFEDSELYKTVSENGVRKAKLFVWDPNHIRDMINEF